MARNFGLAHKEKESNSFAARVLSFMSFGLINIKNTPKNEVNIVLPDEMRPTCKVHNLEDYRALAREQDG